MTLGAEKMGKRLNLKLQPNRLRYAYGLFATVQKI